jgi:hypothetical protein
MRDRKFLFTELECRAAERGVNVAGWRVQGPVGWKEGGEPGSGRAGAFTLVSRR